MKCPTIKHLIFSPQSQKAFEEIKRIKHLSNLLSNFLVSGTLSTIFLGANSTTATYSVYSTDFEVLTRAMMAVPIITRNRIETIAGDTQMTVRNQKEKQFWKAVYLGCKVN
jgi:hypothetical protein